MNARLSERSCKRYGRLGRLVRDAVESFDLDVFDYLVKPIPFARFLKSINKLSQKMMTGPSAEENHPATEKSFIFLKVDKKLIKIKFEDINYIESLKDYIKVITRIGDYLVHKSMTSISEELPKENCIRMHRCFTISINKITSVEGNSVEIGNKRIPIGRNYLQYAKQKILNNKNFLLEIRCININGKD